MGECEKAEEREWNFYTLINVKNMGGCEKTEERKWMWKRRRKRMLVHRTLEGLNSHLPYWFYYYYYIDMLVS